MPNLRYLALAGAVWVVGATASLALTETTIAVLGLPEEETESLVEAMETASVTRQAIEDEITDTRDSLAAAQAEYQTMLSVLYAEGYFGPDISVKVDGVEVATLDPFSLPSQVNTVAIEVTPGKQFRFGDVSITPIAPVSEDVEARNVPGFATGEIARASLIASAVNAELARWRASGHPKVKVAGERIIANHADGTLNVTIALTEGPFLRFGAAHLRSETSVKPKRIQEILALPTGEPYSPDLLRKSVNRLRRTWAFKTVVLDEADEPNADGTLDFDLTVIDNLPRRYGVGAEYSTLDGLLLSGFWLHRNLRGGAEQFRIDTEISNIGGDVGGIDAENAFNGVDYRTTFRLTRPAAFGPDNAFFIEGNLEREDEPDFLERTAQVTGGITRFFTDELYGETSVGYRYSLAEDAFGEREFTHVIFPSRLELDLRDEVGDPRGGYFLGADVQPMIGVLDDESLVYADIDNRAYLTPGSQDTITLAARLRIGTAFGSSREGVPPEFLFFSGGGGTVRGQGYESLAATEQNGADIGGRSFFGTQTEARLRFTDTLGMAVFFDFASVGVDPWVDSDSQAHSGTGLGVRYATPIGPVRVDLATPVTGPTDAFSSVSLYIGVGQAF